MPLLAFERLGATLAGFARRGPDCSGKRVANRGPGEPTPTPSPDVRETVPSPPTYTSGDLPTEHELRGLTPVGSMRVMLRMEHREKPRSLLP